MSASLLFGPAGEQETASGDHSLGKAAGSLKARKGLRAWVCRLEWIAVAVVGGISAALHLRFILNVGGLWRDEANSVALATLPSLREMAAFLDYDSFPILFFTVLRGWLGLFGTDNDVALRALGCLTGFGILLALWLNARAFGARLPVLSFALVGLNPMIIRYGDSSRAYGLGIILILLTLLSFWRLVRRPTSLNLRLVGVATLFALLSVQCLYYNSVLLLAIASGAIAVAATRREWRTVCVILGIGFVAALSLLPYLPMMLRMRAWTFSLTTRRTLRGSGNVCRKSLARPIRSAPGFGLDCSRAPY